MTSGIYQITNQISGKRYIGSAVDIQLRWAVHLSILRHKRHYNVHLQRAFDKYGESAFAFIRLEQIEDIEQLIPREQYYLDTLRPKYNIAPTAGSRLGVQCTDETRAKMRAAKTGERHPMYGKHLSAETRAKISAANRRENLSEETLAKMRAAQGGERHPMYGKHHSAEALAKMRAAHRRENLSEETLAKMRAAQTGRHHSAETKRKMSIAQKARQRRERELKEK